MGYDIGITTTPTDNWFCEGGNCYQHPNGTLTYAQCKASCVIQTLTECTPLYTTAKQVGVCPELPFLVLL